MTVRRHELTDAPWAQLEPLLAEVAPQRPKTGRPNHDHRVVLNGIVWKIRTGAPWRDLPERDGPWQTIYSRFRRWRLAGHWDRLLAAVQRQADAAGQLDWTLHFVAGSVIRAHQHAAGAQRGGLRGPRPKRNRRSATVAAAFRPKCTCGRKATASR